MKSTIIALSIAGIVLSGIVIALALNRPQPLGGTSILPSSVYSVATSTWINCGNVSTVLAGAASGPQRRFDFEVSVASSTAITLCKKATGCVQGAGLLLGQFTTTTAYYTQTDGYWGAYSCIGNGGTSSTVGLIFKQE